MGGWVYVNRRCQGRAKCSRALTQSQGRTKSKSRPGQLPTAPFLRALQGLAISMCVRYALHIFPAKRWKCTAFMYGIGQHYVWCVCATALCPAGEHTWVLSRHGVLKEMKKARKLSLPIRE
eukprot:1159381-Pelagomonas_calceolata.AAC.15